MKIQEFNKSNLKAFRTEFEITVKEMEKKFGIKIDLKAISYAPEEFSSKIQVTVINDGENPQETKDKLSLRKFGYYYGLSESDYGSEIKVGNGEIGKILAVKPNSREYPIVYELNGKRYKTMEKFITKKTK